MGKKIKKLKTKVLTGAKAILLTEGCRLRKDIKEAEERLAEIKKEIRLRSTGNFENEAGCRLKIVDRSIKSKICPRDVFKYFKRKGTPSSILDVVNIDVKALEAVIGSEKMADFQDEVAVNKVWTWEV